MVLVLRGQREGRQRVGAHDVPDEIAAHAPRLGRALRGNGLPSTLEGLIDFYGRNTGDATTTADREAALLAIFREADPSRRLFAALTAIQSDPTAMESDPLWPTIAQQLSQVWQGDLATRGLDLMIAETRPRARQAVISSFARLAETGGAKELTWDQRMTLTDDFVDIFKQVSPSQQAELQRALQAMGSADVANILRGKGGHSDDDLEIQRSYKKALQENVQASATP